MYAGQEPEPGTVRLNGTVTLNFFGTSGVMWNDGSASSTMTMAAGGNSVTATATASASSGQFTPPNPRHVDSPMTLYIPFHGDMGEFTATYTGSMQTSGNGTIAGDFSFDRTLPATTMGVRILEPSYLATVPVAPQSFTVSGWHNANQTSRYEDPLPDSNFWITLTARHSGENEYPKGEVRNVGARGTWAIPGVQIFTPGNFVYLNAYYQYINQFMEERPLGADLVRVQAQ